MSDDTPFASVKILGIDMQATVESIDVEDHDRAIDRARVVFDSADDVSKIAREQQKVEISLGWTNENALIFAGVVMGVKNEALGNGQQRVTVTAYDLSYRMKQGEPKKRSFNSGTLSDAIKELVAEYATAGIQLGDIVPDPNPVLNKLQPLTKPNSQTDWDFIQEKAIQYHCRAFVEVNNEAVVFVFVDKLLCDIGCLGC